MASGRRKPIVIVDWDGTLVTNAWPRMGTWQPGAIEAIKRFLQEGYVVLVHTSRISPFALDGTNRPSEEVDQSIKEIRDMLDAAGLVSVGIWTKPGKPPHSVIIDDKAERYHQTANAWRKLTEKVLLRLGAEEPLYPEWEGGY